MRSRFVALILGLMAVATVGCGIGYTPSKTFSNVGARVESVAVADAVAAKGEAAAAPAGGAMPQPVPEPIAPMRPPQAGTLTAGSFDDVAQLDVFRKFAGKFGQDNSVGDLPSRFLGRELVVTVKGSDGKPVGGARVSVSADGSEEVALPSRTDGRAVFVVSYDRLPPDADLTVTVTAPNAKPVTQTVAKGDTRCEVQLPDVQKALPRNLDLVLVIDTTGSMGDELQYLKTEFSSIVGSIKEKFPEVKQRYGLVVYKDVGDEYVTRTHDFTESLNDYRKNLNHYEAGGGGDTPEAMDAALLEASKLSWRTDDDTARVIFVVADAPPHANLVGKTMDAFGTLRKQGVAVYPVAASGTDDACEFILRSMAILTGGQYLFLTDDSGVGLPHAEPHFPDYVVQRLDKVMTRMIASELSGKAVPPKADEIVRTVGQPTNIER